MADHPMQNVSRAARNAFDDLRRRAAVAERRAVAAERAQQEAEREVRTLRADQPSMSTLRAITERLDVMADRLDALESRGRSSEPTQARSRHGSDLLNGYDEIARYLRWPKQTAKRRALDGILPTFRIGGTVCARRSTLNAWLAEQEAASQEGR